jgi:hypothetical protein
VPRQRPVELLRDLEAHGLRAFAVVGPQVHVHDAPAVAIRDLGAETVHAVVVAADPDERRAEDGGSRELRSLEVVGNKDDRSEPAGDGTRGHGIGQVPRGGAAHRRHPELAGLRERHRDQAVLEREGGMARGVVLDPEVPDAEAPAEPRGRQERREARAVTDGRLAIQWEQLAVSPEVAGPGRDRLAGEAAADGVHVVHGQDGAPAFLAGGHGVRAPLPPALLALESDDEAHRIPRNRPERDRLGRMPVLRQRRSVAMTQSAGARPRPSASSAAPSAGCRRCGSN